MPSLSASTLKLFQDCPRCFWLHLNQRVERPRGPFPSLPSGMDRVLKAYFDRYRRSGALPPLIDGKLSGTLATSALTLGFNDERTGARLWGRLDDCVILPDQRLAPLDHKTRASAPDDVSYTQQYYQFQMDVYTLLLERNGHRTSRTAYVVYYYPLEGVLHEGVPFGVAVHEVPTNPVHAYEIFAQACRCLTAPLPDSSAACEFCAWAESRSRSLPGRAGPEPSRLDIGKISPAASPPRAAQRPPSRVGPAPRAGRPAETIPDDLFA